MKKIKTTYSRRAFLKSSMLAGGGLMISFSGLAQLMLDGKINEAHLPDQWNEMFTSTG